MKQITTWALALTIGLAAAVASAQYTDSTMNNNNATTVQAANPSQLDSKTTGPNVRASQLIGMNVYNSAGKEIGEINDLVINGNTGRVRYAAVSYGGFLGMGESLFAVPWRSFQVQILQDDDEPSLVLNVSEEKIKNSKGFNADKWPDFASRDFTSGVDSYYGVDSDDDYNTRPARRSGVGVNVGPNGVNVDVDGQRRAHPHD